MSIPIKSAASFSIYFMHKISNLDLDGLDTFIAALKATEK